MSLSVLVGKLATSIPKIKYLVAKFVYLEFQKLSYTTVLLRKINN